MAIDLVNRLLEYTPSNRIHTLEACAHSFFDELRQPACKLPNRKELPLLFDFSRQGEGRGLSHTVCVVRVRCVCVTHLYFQ